MDQQHPFGETDTTVKPSQVHNVILIILTESHRLQKSVESKIKIVLIMS